MQERDDAHLRPFAWDDLPALVAVINAAAAHDGEDQATTLDALRERFTRPYFEPERNCVVAALPDGTLAGYCTAELDPRLGKGWGTGVVRPDYRRRGIGMRLLRAADARHRERAAQEVAPDLPVSVTRYTRDTNAATIALLERGGYAVVRASWFMRVDLAARASPPPLPEGVTLRPFERERDARAVWSAEQDIFRDNWGFTPIPCEVWEHLHLGDGFNPALWLVATDAAGEIVGLCLGGAWGDEQPALGWINTLGVRASWRRRGLGSVLLEHGLHVLHAHGFTHAGLEVDAENTSNAVALYERAGMRVYRRYLIFRKDLRDG